MVSSPPRSTHSRLKPGSSSVGGEATPFLLNRRRYIELNPRLRALGWDDWFQERFDNVPGLIPARVAVQHKGTYLVITEDGEMWAEPSGRLMHEAFQRSDLPVVGDWVACRGPQVVGVLQRKTWFGRLESGSRVESASDAPTRTEQQVLAANLDSVMVVTSVTEEFNVRRVERYLTMIFEGGAIPVVILNKADLRDPSDAIRALAVAAPGVDVWAISALTGEGLGELDRYMTGGQTSALVGSSGVGKTSMINRLLGDESRKVRATREDDRDRGRHTTTHRELIQLQSGGMIIDTPGMRELHLWNATDGLERTFDDIAELASMCRFNDCAHMFEPDCAVKTALEDGTLEQDRYLAYQKLIREAEHLKQKQDPRLQRESIDRWKKISKEAKKRSRR